MSSNTKSASSSTSVSDLREPLLVEENLSSSSSSPLRSTNEVSSTTLDDRHHSHKNSKRSTNTEMMTLGSDMTNGSSNHEHLEEQQQQSGLSAMEGTSESDANNNLSTNNNISGTTTSLTRIRSNIVFAQKIWPIISTLLTIIVVYEDTKFSYFFPYFEEYIGLWVVLTVPVNVLMVIGLFCFLSRHNIHRRPSDFKPTVLWVAFIVLTWILLDICRGGNPDVFIMLIILFGIIKSIPHLGSPSCCCDFDGMERQFREELNDNEYDEERLLDLQVERLKYLEESQEQPSLTKARIQIAGLVVLSVGCLLYMVYVTSLLLPESDAVATTLVKLS